MKYMVFCLPLILILLHKTECLKCLRCDGVLNPLLCNRLEICDHSEICMAVKYQTRNKEMLYNVGCFPRNLAQSKRALRGTIGHSGQDKPDSVAHLDSHDHVTCSYCCQTDSCNHKACGNEGFILSRGPICYNCPQTTNPNMCSYVRTCENGEVCRLHEKNHLGLTFFSTSCSTKSDCKIKDQNIFGRRRRKRSLERTECCDSDLCNGSPMDTLIHKTTKTMTSTLITTRPPSQYRDCKDWKDLSSTASSGVYDVYPDGRTRITVYCDMVTDGGGWTVVTSRNGTFNGSRLWEEYTKGFGDINGNFWLGNENIHLLTKHRISDVYFKLQARNGSWYYATYNNFSIGPEVDGYRIHINASSYKGDAGESVGVERGGILDGMMFTTSDKDNDRHPSANCAVSYSVGWWFDFCENNCLTCESPNFEWRYNVGILQTSSMMIRRIV